MPESAAAGSTPVPDTPEPASVGPSTAPPDEESQLLFSASEESSSPLSQRESRYNRPIVRRKPAPMPEALAALHRKATAPAPVPTGRVSRDRSPISRDPTDTPHPLSDHGTPNLGSAT